MWGLKSFWCMCGPQHSRVAGNCSRIKIIAAHTSCISSHSPAVLESPLATSTINSMQCRATRLALTSIISSTKLFTIHSHPRPFALQSRCVWTCSAEAAQHKCSNSSSHAPHVMDPLPMLLPSSDHVWLHHESVCALELLKEQLRKGTPGNTDVWGGSSLPKQQAYHTAIKIGLSAGADDDGAHLDGAHNRHGYNAWLGSQDCFRDHPAAILDELQVLLLHNLEQVIGWTWKGFTIRGDLQLGATRQTPKPPLF